MKKKKSVSLTIEEVESEGIDGDAPEWMAKMEKSRAKKQKLTEPTKKKTFKVLIKEP